MDKLLEMLNAAGYYVWFEPGKFDQSTQTREPGGCTACIQSERARMTGFRDEDWRVHAATPARALSAAAQQMIAHLRPAYDMYTRLTITAEEANKDA